MQNKVVKELSQAKADYFIKLINRSKGNSKLIWDNINRITKKEGKSVQNGVINEHSKVMENKEQTARIFNSLFVDSVQCLAKNFGLKSTVIEPANVDFTIFRVIKNVSKLI